MGIEQEFEALRESTRKQTQATHAGFLQKNSDLAGMIERKGVFIEYVPERDHLYITLGEPQPGMALFAGSIVLLADPETLEFLGLEIPDFKKMIASGALHSDWAWLASVVKRQHILHIPPSVSGSDDFPHDLVRDVQRELAAV